MSSLANSRQSWPRAANHSTLSINFVFSGLFFVDKDDEFTILSEPMMTSSRVRGLRHSASKAIMLSQATVSLASPSSSRKQTESRPFLCLNLDICLAIHAIAGFFSSGLQVNNELLAKVLCLISVVPVFTFENIVSQPPMADHCPWISVYLGALFLFLKIGYWYNFHHPRARYIRCLRPILLRSFPSFKSISINTSISISISISIYFLTAYDRS